MEERLKEICAEILYLDASDIELDAPFKSMNLDSLDLVDLILWIEDEFDVDLPEDYAEYFTCLRDILNHLKADEAI
jgi:acyl carrier protein